MFLFHICTTAVVLSLFDSKAPHCPLQNPNHFPVVSDLMVKDTFFENSFTHISA